MDNLIEQCCAAAWNVHGKPAWDQIPEAWKPFHRACMRAALEVIHKPVTTRIQRQIDELHACEAEAQPRTTPILASTRTYLEPTP